MTLCAHTKDAYQRNNDTKASVRILLIRIRFFRACINFAHVCDISLQSALVVRKRCVEYGQRKKQDLSV